MVRVEHRHGKDDWETPESLFRPLDEEFGFTLDVCASRESKKCDLFCGPGAPFTSDTSEDGLAITWAPHTCWMNPPYSQWQKWVAKAREEAAKGATVVALLPARTDTKAFHELIYNKESVEIRFIKGRVKFVGGAHSAPFPSMLCIFRPPAPTNPDSIEDSFFFEKALLSYLTTPPPIVDKTAQKV